MQAWVVLIFRQGLLLLRAHPSDLLHLAGATDKLKALLRERLLEGLSGLVQAPSLSLARTLQDVVSELSKVTPDDAVVLELVAQSKKIVRGNEIHEMSAELLEALNKYEQGGPLFDKEWAKAEEVEGEELTNRLAQSVTFLLTDLERTLDAGLNGEWSHEVMTSCQQKLRLCAEVSEAH